MTNPAAPERKAFAYQAAVAAIGAPIVGIMLSVATQSALKDQHSAVASLIVGIVCMGLIVIGFVCSIIALAGITRHGKKGLLGRGLVGLLLNGLFILAAVYLLFFFHPLEELYGKYSGTWVVESSPGTTQELRLDGNHQFRLQLSGKSVADVSGEWRLQMENGSNKLFLLLRADHVADGAPGTQGKVISMEVERYESDALHLIDQKGPIVYRRKSGTP